MDNAIIIVENVIIERHVISLNEWLDDTLHRRRLKAFLSSCPSLIQALATAIAYYSFFIGNYADDAFPKSRFWCVTAVLAACFVLCNFWKNLNGKYAKMSMVDFELLDPYTVFYYFYNRKDIEERAIVEIRRIKHSRTVPFALAYIEGQDKQNRKLMIVRPIAFYKNNCYQAGASSEIKKKDFGNYILVSRPLRKEDLDSVSL